MNNIISYLIGFGLGSAFGALNGINGYRNYSDRVIPSQEQVQQGYVAPSKLEIQCKDLDGNGEDEVIMRIGDKPYLLREVDGKPMISAYEIKPAEVLLRSE